MPDCMSAIKKLTASKGQSRRVWVLLCRMRARVFWIGPLSRVTGVKVRRRFLLPLRDHFRRIWLARHPARAEQLPLLIVLGLPRAAIVELWTPSAAALFIDLPAWL